MLWTTKYKNQFGGPIRLQSNDASSQPESFVYVYSNYLSIPDTVKKVTLLFNSSAYCARTEKEYTHHKCMLLRSQRGLERSPKKGLNVVAKNLHNILRWTLSNGHNRVLRRLLDEEFTNQPILPNRAPCLHKISVNMLNGEEPYWKKERTETSLAVKTPLMLAFASGDVESVEMLREVIDPKVFDDTIKRTHSTSPHPPIGHSGNKFIIYYFVYLCDQG